MGHHGGCQHGPPLLGRSWFGTGRRHVLCLDGIPRTSALGRVNPSLLVRSQWLGKPLLGVLCPRQGKAMRLIIHLHWLSAHTRFLKRERAKYPPFPVSHYGRSVLPILCLYVVGYLY